jgi:hypothetical protein
MALPLLKSASFGFPFTAVTGFAQRTDTGLNVPILRVAFGGHDEYVIRQVADAVIERIRMFLDHPSPVAKLNRG